METALYKTVPFHLGKQRRVPVRNKYCGISVFSKSCAELCPEPWLCLSARFTVSTGVGVMKYVVLARVGPSLSHIPGWEKGSPRALCRAWQRAGASPQGQCKKRAVPQAGVGCGTCCPLTHRFQSCTLQKHGILFTAHQSGSVWEFPNRILPLIVLDLGQT